MATYKEISYGAKGDEVKELQTLLNNNGYKLDVDGSFGPKTQAAVKEFQNANKLKVDGIVGENTWGALNKSNTSNAPSNSITQAENMLNQLQNPGTSTWQNQLDDAINKIMNREKFSYDLNGDALYQQYKDKFSTQGKLASMDVMGQAAAMTGGYGNSYAQSVGQQAYQGYLHQLNDKVPELYALAYDRYNQEGQDLLNDYALIAAQEAKDYDRAIAERDWQHMLDREKVQDEQWQKTFDEGRRQFNLQNDGSGNPTGTLGGGLDGIIASILNGLIETPVNKKEYSDIVGDYNELVEKGHSKTEIAEAINDDYRSGVITKAQYDKLMSTFVRSKGSGGHYTY